VAHNRANSAARSTRSTLPPAGRSIRTTLPPPRSARNTQPPPSRSTLSLSRNSLSLSRSSAPVASRNTRNTLSPSARSARASTPLGSRNGKGAPAQNRRTPRQTPRLSLSQRYGLAKLWVWQRLTSMRSLFALLVRLLLAAAVLACVVSVFRLAERYARTSSSFAIVRIDVHGNQHLTGEAVMRAAGIGLGKNVFEVGPEEVRKRLLQVPWIESAQVRRRLPGSYTIEMRERRAVALLSLEELYLVSDDGVAFKRFAGDDPYDLPIISGLDPAQLKRDKRASASALMSAVALLHDYQDAALARREPVSEIRIEPDGGLTLFVGPDATQVRLGKAPFREKLERLREVLNLLAEQKARAAYVLLDNQKRLDRVTVRLR
jgi:cell division protein FtsQ